MKSNCKISDSEWKIMNELWRKNPSTSDEIIKNLKSKVDWSDKTVKSFLNRLLKKQAIGYEKRGRYYHYYPLVTREDCIEEEKRCFIQKAFNGRMAGIISNFIEEADLSQNEISNLKRILQQKENDSKN